MHVVGDALKSSIAPDSLGGISEELFMELWERVLLCDMRVMSKNFCQ